MRLITSPIIATTEQSNLPELATYEVLIICNKCFVVSKILGMRLVTTPIITATAQRILGRLALLQSIVSFEQMFCSYM